MFDGKYGGVLGINWCRLDDFRLRIRDGLDRSMRFLRTFPDSPACCMFGFGNFV